MSTSTAAAKLAPIWRRQHGAFSRRQARSCGFADSTIRRRVESGSWIRAHAGVYLDAAVPRTHEQAVMAACLACGPRGVASHLSAALLLGLDFPSPEIPDVTVPRTMRPRDHRIRVHRTASIEPHEVARVAGIPITSAARTLVDLAGELDPVALEIALDTLWRRGSIRPEKLARYLEAWHRRPGAAVLRALVVERIGGRPPGSDLETVYLQILKSFRVPVPVRQHPVATRSGRRFIDLAYPDQGLAIELDSFDRHARDRSVFDDDRVRRNDLDALGWRIKQFTWTHCVQDRVYVAMTTAEAIGLVPSRWRPAGDQTRRRA